MKAVKKTKKKKKKKPPCPTIQFHLQIHTCLNNSKFSEYQNILNSICYSRAFSEYQCLFERGILLTMRRLTQEYQRTKLVPTLKKFYGRHHDLVSPYNVGVSRLTSDVYAAAKP